VRHFVSANPTEYVFKGSPDHLLVRIGAKDPQAAKERRTTDPFYLWQPKGWNHPRRRADGTFGYRFDDPGWLRNPPLADQDMFRVLYCASELVGAACEVAAWLRPTTGELAVRTGQPIKGVMDEAWCEGLLAAYTAMEAGLLFVDLSAHRTSNALSEVQDIASWANAAGYHDFHPRMFQGPNYRLTQEVARHIYEQTQPGAPGLRGQPPGTMVAGIYYLSRNGDGDRDFPCWAMCKLPHR
jgi:hypothetical protein